MNNNLMKVEPGLYVTFEYSMTLENGDRVGGSDPDQPFGFIVGRGHMLPIVEKKLMGMQAETEASFWLMPGEAFGDPDPANIREVPREVFPAEAKLEVDMLFQAPGAESPYPFTVTAVTEKTVTVDMNHPLSSKKIKLDVKIHSIRPLTPQEEAEIIQSNQGPPVPGMVTLS